VFHAQARPLEVASPFLRDMFNDLMTRERNAFEAVAMPEVTGVAQDLAHAAFSKAVEFAYTGTVEWGGDKEEDLLPAVLATAHHLQMEALQDWCLERLARRAAGPQAGREAAVRAALESPMPHEATLSRCRALADACAAWAVEVNDVCGQWRNALQPALEALILDVSRSVIRDGV
jgi:hypothetical protein